MCHSMVELNKEIEYCTNVAFLAVNRGGLGRRSQLVASMPRKYDCSCSRLLSPPIEVLLSRHCRTSAYYR